MHLTSANQRIELAKRVLSAALNMRGKTMRDIVDFIYEAGRVKPSKRQLKWFERGFYGFVHFTVNTYTGREWGLGDEDEMIFNPTDLNCDEWVETFKNAGMKGLILTCKHHDGFCLWPSKFTEHSVKNSLNFKNGHGDVVKEAAEACKRGGIGFGIYLSPWDRNSKYYGTDAYNDYYCNQLTELLTSYGELFMVWFDGACGEGPNGKKQIYDFERYVSLVRKYQPNASIFYDKGPDVRWGGNEDGAARTAEWSVVPTELCPLAEKQTFGKAMQGSLDGIQHCDPELGALSEIVYSDGLAFVPSEFDMSIRPGWFYHPEEKPHSLERLFNTYLTTVGSNAGFNLNIPPMPNGRMDPRDIVRAKELGEKLKEAFGMPLTAEWTIMPGNGGTQATVEITLPEKQKVRFIELREDISEGQRIESFHVRVPEIFEHAATGMSVGFRKILKLKNRIFRDNDWITEEFVETDRLTVQVTAARGPVRLKEVILYG